MSHGEAPERVPAGPTATGRPGLVVSDVRELSRETLAREGRLQRLAEECARDGQSGATTASLVIAFLAGYEQARRDDLDATRAAIEAAKK